MDFPLLAEIKKRRTALGLSQKQLADLSGIGQSFLAKIERAQAMPSYAVATRVFERLGSLESKNAEKLPLTYRLLAADIMTPYVYTFGPDDAAERVLKVMIEKDISQVPVLDERELQQGIITEKSLLGKELKGKMVKDVLDGEHVFPMVAKDTRLQVVIGILQQEEQAVLVTEKGKIVGIITKQDVLRSVKKGRGNTDRAGQERGTDIW
jgi:predicted transcriptional regulator